MNRKQKIKLLTQIAAGEMNPKELLPKKKEVWVKTTVVKSGKPESPAIYKYKGRTLSEAEFENHVQENPQAETIIVHVRDTAVPLARSEKEARELYR
ncbi:MAG TPA: hypothetical protein VGN63_14975 [Flavisolibacter sp.]|jgi:beta-lactamase class A|nr:hypothetical protein [Flavisolibacter sp.]